ncbi:MAG: zeta toxin family protein [Verrucomicrobiota bacterium]
MRPRITVFAGPNGAGKSTLRAHLYLNHSHPFVNADEIAKEEGLGAYQAAELAAKVRSSYVEEGSSFMFETILSDPVGAKVAFLEDCQSKGFEIVVHFVGLDSVERSRARVTQRVLHGGHDVPDDKIQSRYPRTIANLIRLIPVCDQLLVYDNSSYETPYQLLARFEKGSLKQIAQSLPEWIRKVGLAGMASDETESIR